MTKTEWQQLESLKVENPEQARLVYDPEYGIRLLGFFLEPHISSEAAAKLGEPANRIAYHVGKLAEAGLLQVVGARGKRTLYQTVAREFMVPKVLLPMHLTDTSRAIEPMLRGLLTGMANSNSATRDAEGMVVRLAPAAPTGQGSSEPFVEEIKQKADFVAELKIAPLKLTPARFRELQTALAAVLEDFRDADSKQAQDCTFALVSYRGKFRPGGQ